MSTLPAIVTNQLATLVPMLGSDKPGEVAATVEAIKRRLKAADLDFHDLAKAIKSPAPSQSKPKQPSYLWQVIARACLKHNEAFRLSPREVDFLGGMARWPTAPSEKQTAWLQTIAETLGVNARAA